MTERRIRPIGDDDDERFGDGPQNVGSGCASLTPDEGSGDQLKHAAKFVLRMRKAGATYVKLGDVEVGFGVPEPAKPEG